MATAPWGIEQVWYTPGLAWVRVAAAEVAGAGFRPGGDGRAAGALPARPWAPWAPLRIPARAAWTSGCSRA
jgi:hypothetical protein